MYITPTNLYISHHWTFFDSYNVLSAALPFDGATFSYKKNFRFFFTTTLWSFRSQFFSGECFLVGFDDVREKRPVDNFLGLYEEKRKRKKCGVLFICVRCVSFLLVVEGFYFLLPSAASYTRIVYI
jgi:hypothetical protein